MPFIPRKLNTKNSNLDWINLIAGLHDLQCDCTEPLKHTIEEIHKQEPSLQPSKCLTTEKATTEDDGFGTRRPRGPFRRRWWRRRRNYRRYYGVRRKRKLPFLKLIQWQPQYIRKLRVCGTLPLYITTNARVANNLTLYKDTIAPHYVPSMGGFSITQITLQALYQQFYKGRAWWTQSTNDFPLIRYLYCNMYLYRAESSDYMITFHNCYPMKASLEAYQATQPSMMLIHPHRHIMRCKKHNYIKKPYRKIKIHPPAQLKNQWFFLKRYS